MKITQHKIPEWYGFGWEEIPSTILNAGLNYTKRHFLLFLGFWIFKVTSKPFYHKEKNNV